MTVPTRELRHDIPKEIVDGLDGIALARGISRGELVAQVLGRFIDQSIHEARVLLQFVRDNGRPPDPGRSAPE